jgi:thiamine-phosphate pyrophosphorylase
VAAGADYIGVGPVHATPTKPGRQPVGFGYLQQAVGAAVRPAYAIGGIDLDTVDAVLATGVFGVAVVRAVMEARDPAAATAALLERLEAHPVPLRRGP